ncbi:PepSY domain-containing protein [Fictibacillus gelatini]|uniref:PepSY domain-containing protein n=1 Tax=Fictibacillus gelatini TaxID=225985 RepID=UPI00041B161D|nr:PepSY domain-containing protein [Fictibacillus gelatini]
MKFGKKKGIVSASALALAAGIGTAGVVVHAANANVKISKEQARQMVADQLKGKVTKQELDHDDGKVVYDMDVIAHNNRYDVDLDANTGKMINVEKDEEHNGDDHEDHLQNVNPKISVDQAVSIASAHAKGTPVDLELDEEHGKMIYEIDLQEKTTAHEVKIDAATGKVLNVKPKEVDDDLPGNARAKISIDQAAANALTKENGTVTDIELDKKRGKLVYEINIQGKSKDYEVKIDATSGSVLSVKAETPDHED